MCNIVKLIRSGEIEIRDCPVYGKPYKAMFNPRLAALFGDEDGGYRAVGFKSCLDLIRTFKDMK